MQADALTSEPPGKPSLTLPNWVSGVVGGSDGHSCSASRLKEALSEEGATGRQVELAMSASATRKQHIELVFTPAVESKLCGYAYFQEQ